MNQVRIIGGKWKGRKLRFPDRQQLRPSLGRMRETLFNWLMADIAGAHCLDAYAGSGALGLEALSRGAASLVLLDADAAVVSALRQNCAQLDAAGAQVIQAKARVWLAHQHRQWDLVFLDPPYKAPKTTKAGRASTPAPNPELGKVLALLLAQQSVHADSLVYIEFAKGLPPPLAGWEIYKQTQTGDSQSMLLRPAAL